MISQEKKKKIDAEKQCGQSVTICLYKDKVSGLYSSPLSFNSIESAKRHFKSLLVANGLNTDDYELYYLMNYSPSTGIIYLDDIYIERQPIPIEEVEDETQEE